MDLQCNLKYLHLVLNVSYANILLTLGIILFTWQPNKMCGQQIKQATNLSSKCCH